MRRVRVGGELVMPLEQPLEYVSPQPLVEEKRRCRFGSCGTVLNRFNRTPYCSIHGPHSQFNREPSHPNSPPRRNSALSKLPPNTPKCGACGIAVYKGGEETELFQGTFTMHLALDGDDGRYREVTQKMGVCGSCFARHRERKYLIILSDVRKEPRPRRKKVGKLQTETAR